MALVKTSAAITDIRGPIAGCTFTRDKSGLHLIAKKRMIAGGSVAQIKQRKAFSDARQFSRINRTVSYNIYRILTGLDPCEPPDDFSISEL